MSVAADTSGPVCPQPRPDFSNDVIVNVYHCDNWTGMLNKWWLKDSEMPIYHLGVQVFGEEWSFLYFEDSWDDESVSGVMTCQPRHMFDFDFQYAVNLGPTPLGIGQVDEVLLKLHYSYPACSYHLTRRNCMTFAHEFVEQLKPPEPFPLKLKGIVDATGNAPRLNATVDYGWSWAKWYMLRKAQQEKQARAIENGAAAKQPNGYLCCSTTGSDHQAGMWNIWSMCDAGRKTDAHDEQVVSSTRSTARSRNADVRP